MRLSGGLLGVSLPGPILYGPSVELTGRSSYFDDRGFIYGTLGLGSIHGDSWFRYDAGVGFLLDGNLSASLGVAGDLSPAITAGITWSIGFAFQRS